MSESHNQSNNNEEYHAAFPEMHADVTTEPPAWLTQTESDELTVPIWVTATRKKQESEPEVSAETAEKYQQAQDEAYARGLEEGTRQAQKVMEEKQEELLTRLREEVYLESHEQGLKAGEKAGYDAGYETGSTLATQEGHEQMALLHSIINATQVWQAAQEKQQLQELGTLVSTLTKEVIVAELKFNTEVVTAALAAALKAIPKTAEQPIVEINPADRNRIEQLQKEQERAWLITEDATIQAGGCRIRTSQSDVDATIERRLKLAQDAIKNVFLEFA